MGKGLFIGEGNIARKVKKVFVGVEDTPHKVKKIFIGDENNVPRLAFSGSKKVKMLFGCFPYSEANYSSTPYVTWGVYDFDNGIENIIETGLATNYYPRQVTFFNGYYYMIYYNYNSSVTYKYTCYLGRSVDLLHWTYIRVPGEYSNNLGAPTFLDRSSLVHNDTLYIPLSPAATSYDSQNKPSRVWTTSDGINFNNVGSGQYYGGYIRYFDDADDSFIYCCTSGKIAKTSKSSNSYTALYSSSTSTRHYSNCILYKGVIYVFVLDQVGNLVIEGYDSSSGQQVAYISLGSGYYKQSTEYAPRIFKKDNCIYTVLKYEDGRARPYRFNMDTKSGVTGALSSFGLSGSYFANGKLVDNYYYYGYSGYNNNNGQTFVYTWMYKINCETLEMTISNSGNYLPNTPHWRYYYITMQNDVSFCAID